MAADQRYCLACGHRRGDPRLPFMDAVVFMDAAKQPPQAAAPPPPPSAQRPRISANASLIAGIATLVLAVGVGVLIGRSGENSAAPVAATPQVIKVGGGTEPESTTPTETGKAKGSKGTTKKTTPKEESEATAAAEKATEEVYPAAPGVNLAKPGSVQKGGACETGTAGCENGKFEGNFFGE
jgi:hypothetical protein